MPVTNGLSRGTVSFEVKVNIIYIYIYIYIYDSSSYRTENSVLQFKNKRTKQGVFGEMRVVYSANHREHINTLCWQIVEFRTIPIREIAESEF